MFDCFSTFFFKSSISFCSLSISGRLVYFPWLRFFCFALIFSISFFSARHFCLRFFLFYFIIRFLCFFLISEIPFQAHWLFYNFFLFFLSFLLVQSPSLSLLSRHRGILFKKLSPKPNFFLIIFHRLRHSFRFYFRSPILPLRLAVPRRIQRFLGFIFRAESEKQIRSFKALSKK